MPDGCVARTHPAASARPGRHRLGIALAMLLTIGAAPARAADPSATDPGQVAIEVARDGDIQTELPTAAPLPPPSAIELNPPMSVLDIALWIAVLCGAGVIAYFISDILPKGGLARRSRWGAADDPAGTAGPRSGEAAQIAADQLAQQGRFVEAIHVLLLQSLAEVRRRLDLRFADSLTSREIVRRAGLPNRAEQALSDIVERVERAYFGTHPTGAEDYQACRERYEVLSRALLDKAPA
jgi:hypothetical protein